MTTITTRQTTAANALNKNATLTSTELDQNFIALNLTKLDQSPDTSTTQPSLNLDFTRGVLDPRVTFTRASTATYYDGVTTSLAEQNLLSYSQDFANSAWTSILYTSISANTLETLDPLGANTASILLGDSSTNERRLGNQTCTVIAGSTYTFSIYVKYKNWQYIYLRLDSAAFGATQWGVFDLITGSCTQASNVTYTSTSVGNSWYRVSITAPCSLTKRDSSGPYIYFSDSATPSTIGPISTTTSTSGIYIWGAQLEQRSAAAAYVPTAQYPVTVYQPQLLSAPPNTPRFDCDPVTGRRLGLLVEEQRTNLIVGLPTTGSSQVQSITPNIAIAPDGTQTASAMTFIANSYQSANGRSAPFAYFPANTYTISVYIKAGNLSRVGLRMANSAYGVGDFDLASGTCVNQGAVSVGMINVGNGWYRCITTITNLGTNDSVSIGCFYYPFASSGKGYDFYFWGAQLEVGSYATSYIPTSGSQVTRAWDSASMSGTNFSTWYNQTQGTFIAQTFNGTSGRPVYRVGISGPGDMGLVIIYPNAVIDRATVGTVLSSGTVNISGLNKYALAYSLTSILASTNGGNVVTSTNATSFSTATKLGIGINLDNSGALNGYVMRIIYIPVQLTALQLQTLTAPIIDLLQQEAVYDNILLEDGTFLLQE